MLVLDAKSRADGIVGEFAWLVRGIPALHDLIEFLRQILRGVRREPSGLHHAAGGGRGRLLILAGEIVGTKAAAQGF